MAVVEPTNLTYGTVIGKFIQTSLDSADAGREQDYSASVGVVTFTPDVRYYKNLGTPPMTINTTTVTAVIDSNGDLRDTQGALGVVLMATDNPQLSPRDWSYTVNVTASGVSYSFSIKVLGGTTQDITLISPVPSTPGVQVVTSSADRVLAQQAAAAAAQSAAEAAASAGSGGGGGLTPGAVLDIHVASNAAILLSKTSDSTAGAGRLAMTNAERTKLNSVASNATSWTAEEIQDLISTFIVEGVGIDVVYNDASNTLTITNTGVTTTPSADAGNALILGTDSKLYLDSDQFAAPGPYALPSDLDYVLRGWLLEATEDASDVPVGLPTSTSTSFTIILRKLP